MATVTQDDLEKAIPAETVRQLFDDDGDGVADAATVLFYLDAAEAAVNATVEQLYPLPWATPPGPPALYKTLVAWMAVGLAYGRHPEYVRDNGTIWLDRANDMLSRIRKGEMGFDTGAPANERMFARSGSSLDPEPRPMTFNGPGAFGDF